MDKIELPESLQFYYQSTENANAIESLANKTNTGSKHIPQDLSFDELESFHRAILATHQTQVDAWVFMRQVCELVWRPAIARTAFANEYVAHSPKDYEKSELSIDSVWENGFYISHNLKGGWLITGCWITEDSLQLFFYFQNASSSYTESNELRLNQALWEFSRVDDQHNSRPSCGELSGRSSLDLTDLRDAANEAMTELATALKT